MPSQKNKIDINGMVVDHKALPVTKNFFTLLQIAVER